MASKKAGFVHDPWRRAAAPQPAPEPVTAPETAPVVSGAPRGDTDDFRQDKRAAVVLKGYGGISVEGSYDRKQVAIQVINFCADNLAAIEPILNKYGVLVIKLEGPHPDTPLYIRREDGWTLTVPFAKDRSQGILQLIQALLEIGQEPKLRPLMKKYRLQPFKL